VERQSGNGGHSTIRVAVSGAAGRMGRAAVRALAADPSMRVVAAFGRASGIGSDAGALAGTAPLGVALRPAEEIAGLNGACDVLVDFASGEPAMENTARAAAAGVRPITGGTGYSAAGLEALRAVCAARGIGGVVAPNFAIGAVLMTVFAERAARYMPHVEIVELHHDRKKDAPSGTALRTAQLIEAVRGAAPAPVVHEEETIEGVRGGLGAGVRIHSVRLPGLVAHQEVIFGAAGQTLRIRHDSVNEQSFMPGVLLAVRAVLSLDRLVVGLENLLEI
jgi:4-hydroxy-tetrahydrodipicolinate reductase